MYRKHPQQKRSPAHGRGCQRLAAVLRLCAAVCLVFILLAGGGHGAEFRNTLSLQGYTGLLNTPNAEVTDQGKISALYTNQKEDKWRALTPREESYMFSVGLFPIAEVGGRLTDAPGARVRDLSANVKLQVPFIPKGRYLPDIAVGIQDIGGGGKLLATKYVVATEELWRLRLSAGYGTGPQRMKGVFGGVEVRLWDWLYLIAENDTRDNNAGARLVTPDLFGIPVNLQATAKTSLRYRPGHPEFAFGLQFPLGVDRHNRTPLVEEPEPGKGIAPDVAEKGPGRDGGTGEDLSGSVNGAPVGVDDSRLVLLLERLTAEGFQNVRVGRREDALLVVEYENGRYDWNELDGLGVAVGMVVDTIPSGFRTVRLVMKKKGIRVLQVSAPLSDFAGFLKDPQKLAGFDDRLRITSDIDGDGGIAFVAGNGNPSWLHSSISVYPGLKTFVGTEVGNFDYLLSAKVDYFLNAWKGAAVNARWDIPVAWSENFRDRMPFRNSRRGTQFERLMLFQAIGLTPKVMANLGGGMIVHDAYGTLNEIIWSPGDGTSRFGFKQAYLSGTKDSDRQGRTEVYLGSYRYFFAPFDLSLTMTGGKFFDNDRGFSVEMKRFFGDTAFSVFYKNSRTVSSEHVQVGGVQVAFPLTFRRGMKPYLVQVRGSDEWSYAQETKLVAAGGANSVSTSIGVDPELPYSLDRVFLNRDRLSEPYIREHLLRLRDAYMRYGRIQAAPREREN